MQACVDGAPAPPAVGALEDAPASPLIAPSPGIERGWRQRINHQGVDVTVEALRPVSPAIGAFVESGVVIIEVRRGAGVEGVRRRRINGQGLELGVEGVDGRPAPPAVGALEDAPASPAVALGPGIERVRRRRIDGQGADNGLQAGVGGRPAPPAAVALEDAPDEGAGIEAWLAPKDR